MSFILRDPLAVPMYNWNKAMYLRSKLNKYWSTHTIKLTNGRDVEVYNKTRTFFRNSTGYIDDKVSRDFLLALGFEWEDFTSGASDLDGEIETLYWVMKHSYRWNGKRRDGLIEPGEATDLRAPTEAELVYKFDELGRAIPKIDDEDPNYGGKQIVDVTISYGGSLGMYIDEHKLDYNIVPNGTASYIEVGTLNTEKIREVIHARPWYYIANSRHIIYPVDGIKKFTYVDNNVGTVENPTPLPQPRPAFNNPPCDISSTSELGILAVLDTDEGTFKLIRNKDGSPKVFNESQSTADQGSDGIAIRYTYTYKYEYIGHTEHLANEVLPWYSNILSSAKLPIAGSLTRVDAIITSTIDTKIKRLLDSFRLEDLYLHPFIISETIEDNLYVKVITGANAFGYAGSVDYYLKKGSVDAMKTEDFMDMIPDLLDTDYSVVDKEWWENLAAALIAIIAVAIAVLVCAGTFGTGCGASVAGLGSLATALGTAGIVLTLGNIALAELGGLSSANNIKILGGVATVLGYAAAIIGIYAAITASWKSAVDKLGEEAINSATAAADGPITEAVMEAAVESVGVTDILIEMASNALSTVFSATSTLFTQGSEASVGVVVNAVTEVVGMANKIFDFILDEEQKKLDAEYAEYEKEQDAYNEMVLNRAEMKASAIYEISHERSAAYDCLQELEIAVEAKIGQDNNYMIWYKDVNAI